MVAAASGYLLVPGLCLAQLSTGTVVGTVRDASGGVTSGAPVSAVSGATGQVRTTLTSEQGEFSVPVLPGKYELSVAALGVNRVPRTVLVEAGSTSRAGFGLRVGDISESVHVQGAPPRIRYDSVAVGGVLTPRAFSNEGDCVSYVQEAQVTGCSTPPGVPANLTINPSSSAVGPTWSVTASGATSYVVRAGSAPGLSDYADYETVRPPPRSRPPRRQGPTTCAFMRATPVAALVVRRTSSFSFCRDDERCSGPGARK
jgi:hypothetical protein